MRSKELIFSGDAIPVKGDPPVYEDAVASVQSIKQLSGLAGILILLSAWDDPRMRGEAYAQMDRALEYLQEIHRAVLTNSNITDVMELSRITAASIGLPPQAVNPLLARTLAANLRVRDVENLSDDPRR